MGWQGIFENGTCGKCGPNMVDVSQDVTTWDSYHVGGGGGKTGSICHFAFSFVFQCLGPKISTCWEKQHEKCHCRTPFCVCPKCSQKLGLESSVPVC